MQTIPPTTDLHPGWRVQLAVHRAVRRDAGRLATALAPDRATPAAAIQAYWSATAEQLHEHHVFEDTVVWPLLLERLGHEFDQLLARNAREHAAMASAMQNFSDVVTTMTTDAGPARGALAQLVDAIEAHLAHEEADVLPLIPEAFTMQDMQNFSAEAAKTDPPERFLPWLLDNAADDDLAFFTANLPEPVRTQLESNWMPERLAVVNALGI
jgi:hemerythrin-like domain-containing protein